MMEETLTFALNGVVQSVRGVPLTRTVLEYLRATGLVGTKEGCGDGDCGACTIVILKETLQGKLQYQAVNSCILPLGALSGREVITVEGIANAQLHPVQAAMVKTGGSQCGYCTPGFIMSLFAGYYTDELSDLSVEGNLCRCTGYLPIREAARSLEPPQAKDPFFERLTLDKAFIGEVSRTEESFFHPQHLSDLFTLMDEYPEAPLIAGGTDLGLELSHKTRDVPVLISLEGVEELNFSKDSPDYLEIGAGLSLTHIEKHLKARFPALDEMLHWFAARQIRNRATLGGNLATASPIGDLPPVLLALDAELKLASAAGERMFPLADFFTGYRQTVLKANEVIVSARLPKAMSEGAKRRLSQSYKVGKRGTDDISIVAAAFTVDLDAEDSIVHARLAYGGVAATPVRALDVETLLLNKVWNEQTVQEAKTQLKETFSPLDDVRGSAAYRNLLVANLFEKFYVEHSHAEVAP